MENTKILIIGCGRSGTLFMTKVFEVLGLDIGHEQIGENGVSSWLHSFGNRQKRLLQKHYKPFNKVFIHLVRNPLKVIQSMTIVSEMRNRRGLNYFKDICPDETKNLYGYELGMFYWIFWNKTLERRSAGVDFRIKVEDLRNKAGIVSLCDSLRISYKECYCTKIQEIGKETHKVPRRITSKIIDEKEYLRNELTIEHLKKINPVMTEELVQLADRYGYKL